MLPPFNLGYSNAGCTVALLYTLGDIPIIFKSVAANIAIVAVGDENMAAHLPDSQFPAAIVRPQPPGIADSVACYLEAVDVGKQHPIGVAVGNGIVFDDDISVLPGLQQAGKVQRGKDADIDSADFIRSASTDIDAGVASDKLVVPDDDIAGKVSLPNSRFPCCIQWRASQYFRWCFPPPGNRTP